MPKTRTRSNSKSMAEYSPFKSAMPRKKRPSASRARKRNVRVGHCANCGVDETSTQLWRSNNYNPEKGMFCNACGLWYNEKGCLRPQELWRHGKSKVKDGPSSPPSTPELDPTTDSEDLKEVTESVIVTPATRARTLTPIMATSSVCVPSPTRHIVVPHIRGRSQSASSAVPVLGQTKNHIPTPSGCRTDRRASCPDTSTPKPPRAIKAAPPRRPAHAKPRNPTPAQLVDLEGQAASALMSLSLAGTSQPTPPEPASSASHRSRGHPHPRPPPDSQLTKALARGYTPSWMQDGHHRRFVPPPSSLQTYHLPPPPLQPSYVHRGYIYPKVQPYPRRASVTTIAALTHAMDYRSPSSPESSAYTSPPSSRRPSIFRRDSVASDVIATPGSEVSELMNARTSPQGYFCGATGYEYQDALGLNPSCM